MKLPNGFGPVYKLSGNRRKPYRAIVTERWQIDTETGKWKQKRKTIGYYESIHAMYVPVACHVIYIALFQIYKISLVFGIGQIFYHFKYFLGTCHFSSIRCCSALKPCFFCAILLIPSTRSLHTSI